MQNEQKKTTFLPKFSKPLWASSSEAERKIVRERENLKGRRDNWGLEREGIEGERVVNDQEPKKGWAPRPICSINRQSIVLNTGFHASVFT